MIKIGLKAFKVDDNKIVGSSSNRINKMFGNSFKNNKLRDLMHVPNIKAIKKPIFLTPNAKKVFNQL